MGHAPLGVAEGDEVTAHRNTPSLVARSDEIEGEIQGLPEESAAASPCQTGQSETQSDGMGHSPSHPSLRQVSTGAGGEWMLKHGMWRTDLGLLLAAWRQSEGIGVRTYAAGNASGGRSPDCRGSKPPLLSGTCRKGSHCGLSPHTPPLQALRELLPEWAHAPGVATMSLSGLSKPPCSSPPPPPARPCHCRQ